MGMVMKTQTTWNNKPLRAGDPVPSEVPLAVKERWLKNGLATQDGAGSPKASAPKTDSTGDDLGEMSVKQLKKAAEGLGIDTKGLDRDGLIDAIRTAQGAGHTTEGNPGDSLDAMDNDELAAFAKENKIDVTDLDRPAVIEKIRGWLAKS